MGLLHELMDGKARLAIIGLGYVGLPLAVELSKYFNVLGYDINSIKIDSYIKGIDKTREVGDDTLKSCKVEFTSNSDKLKECKFHIISVPTPINLDKTPNLQPIRAASEIVAKNLSRGSIIVYESTVYPGTTEEICIPLIEKISGLKCGIDFKVGYSPERINPGDKENKLTNIKKIVSGCDEESLSIIGSVYEKIIMAGIYKAENIKVAEAAKIIENSQRDINIAFMNELAMVFNEMDIDTNAVIRAASTKWNFLNFKPGLVGGHCIGVDPYYFIYKAEELGYHSQIILSGRRINDNMSKFIVENIIKTLTKAKKAVYESKVAIMGITFKENCPDIRNTKVVDIIEELKQYNVEVLVYDPVAQKEEAYKEYGINLCELEELNELDAIIITVAHDEIKELSLDDFIPRYKDKSYILIDVKGVFERKIAQEKEFVYWSL